MWNELDDEQVIRAGSLQPDEQLIVCEVCGERFVLPNQPGYYVCGGCGQPLFPDIDSDNIDGDDDGW